METVKYKIIWLWLTRCFLRRLGKRYPEWFEKVFVPDLTDNLIARRVMILRYAGKYPMKFEAIAIELGTDVRNIFTYHKKVLDSMIVGI